MYVAVTDDIEVRANTQFLEERSNPGDQQFVWAYDIEIINHGSETVQLLTRHWTITSADGSIDVVEGDGVVGKQPVLAGGERFSYQSAAPLDTPSGIMVGYYIMQQADHRLLKVRVPALSLDSPYEDGAYH